MNHEGHEDHEARVFVWFCAFCGYIDFFRGRWRKQMIRPVCFWPGLGLSGPCYSTPIPIPTPTPIHTLTYSHTRIPVGLRHDLRRGGDAVALPARCASTPHTPTHSLRFPALWPQATEKRQSGRREASGRRRRLAAPRPIRSPSTSILCLFGSFQGQNLDFELAWLSPFPLCIRWYFDPDRARQGRAMSHPYHALTSTCNHFLDSRPSRF